VKLDPVAACRIVMDGGIVMRTYNGLIVPGQAMGPAPLTRVVRWGRRSMPGPWCI
jgi:hypothetical protein